MPLDMYFDYLGIRLNGPKAAMAGRTRPVAGQNACVSVNTAASRPMKRPLALV
jgi:hypothetical protein